MEVRQGNELFEDCVSVDASWCLLTPIERLETNRATAHFCWAMSGPVIPINIDWSLSQDQI